MQKNNFMEPVIPSIQLELKKIHRSEFAQTDYSELISELNNFLENEYSLDLDSSLTEVMNNGDVILRNPIADIKSTYYTMNVEDFDRKLKMAGDVLQVIESTIQNIENDYKQDTIDEIIDLVDIIQKPVIKWEAHTIGFYCNQQDPDIKLKELLYFLLVPEFGGTKILNRNVIRFTLMSLSRGVADSLLLRDIRLQKISLTSNISEHPSISNNNEQVEKESTDDFMSTKTKLKWTGTPAEFGFIISELVTKGYLQEYPNFSATCKVMLTVFDIHSDKGNIVARRTLEDYFGRNRKSYPNGVFKLPFSDNYVDNRKNN